MSEPINVMEVFNNLPEREQKLVMARAWILKNDHFLFPLEGETDFNHHARILMVYAEMVNARLRREVEILEPCVRHYAQGLGDPSEQNDDLDG